MLVGITRVRNESLIIADTICHFLGWCDCIVLYDDCSTDDTVARAREVGGNRLHVIAGDQWLTERQAEETRHRRIAHEFALSLGADWCLCFDADERLVGKLPDLNGDGFRFRLFDAYLTEDRQQAYAGGDLAELPRMWGPEFRDILMLFRADKALYKGVDLREPVLKGNISFTPVMVKHFGKCLSIDHWEETCDYYARFFPEPYRSKWNGRRGKAIHQKSDFGRELYTWTELMRQSAQWQRI